MTLQGTATPQGNRSVLECSALKGNHFTVYRLLYSCSALGYNHFPGHREMESAELRSLCHGVQVTLRYTGGSCPVPSISAWVGFIFGLLAGAGFWWGHRVTGDPAWVP